MYNTPEDHFQDKGSFCPQRYLRDKRKKGNYSSIPESYIKNEANGIRNGRWSINEHKKFIFAIFKHGNNWKEIANELKTRTCSQARSHCQKFFSKIIKIGVNGITEEMCNVRTLHDLAMIINIEDLKKLSDILIEAHERFDKLDRLENISSNFQEPIYFPKISLDKSTAEHSSVSKATSLNSVASIDITKTNLAYSNDPYNFMDEELMHINENNEYSFENVVDGASNSKEELEFNDDYDMKIWNIEDGIPCNENQLILPDKKVDLYYDMMKSKMFSYMNERGELILNKSQLSNNIEPDELLYNKLYDYQDEICLKFLTKNDS